MVALNGLVNVYDYKQGLTLNFHFIAIFISLALLKFYLPENCISNDVCWHTALYTEFIIQKLFGLFIETKLIQFSGLKQLLQSLIKVSGLVSSLTCQDNLELHHSCPGRLLVAAWSNVLNVNTCTLKNE